MKDDGMGHRRCETRDARWGVEDGGGERCKLGYAGGKMMEWEIADEGWEMREGRDERWEMRNKGR